MGTEKSKPRAPRTRALASVAVRSRAIVSTIATQTPEMAALARAAVYEAVAKGVSGTGRAIPELKGIARDSAVRARAGFGSKANGGFGMKGGDGILRAVELVPYALAAGLVVAHVIAKTRDDERARAAGSGEGLITGA